MFERVGRAAERAAVGLSRRAFLGRLGRIGGAAMAFATFVGTAAADQPSCVLNGGCCGGGHFPYLNTDVHGKTSCWNDSRCRVLQAACADSKCCNSGGGCWLGVTCYQDTGCDILC
jgi:hypothetical protein